MEELVNVPADLQERQKIEEDTADQASSRIDIQIKDVEDQLEMLNDETQMGKFLKLFERFDRICFKYRYKTISENIELFKIYIASVQDVNE